MIEFEWDPAKARANEESMGSRSSRRARYLTTITPHVYATQTILRMRIGTLLSDFRKWQGTWWYPIRSVAIGFD